jgi:hypothetical protein
MNSEKIYELLYSPMTTPSAILDNIYFDNYEYIKFYKKFNGILVGEIKCTCYGDNFRSIFYYHFDKSSFLQKIIKKNKYGIEEVFNREKELSNIKNSMIQEKQIIAG